MVRSRASMLRSWCHMAATRVADASARVRSIFPAMNARRVNSPGRAGLAPAASRSSRNQRLRASIGCAMAPATAR